MNVKNKSKKKKSVKLTFHTEPEKDIFLAGTFNNWSPKANPMIYNKDSGVYECSLLLPRGEYEYKFIIDNQWSIDPYCRKWHTNSLGTLNSILTV